MAITYRDTIPAYAVGRRANMEEWNTITRTNEGATDIPFGVPVIPGSGPHTCLPAADANNQNILGITEASQTVISESDGYPQYENVAICEVGVIGVLLGANVTVGQAANWDTSAGKWTSDAVGSGVISVPGAQFDAAGSSGDVGIVRYRRPVPSTSANS